MLLDVLQHYVLFSSATSHVRSCFFPATTLLNVIIMVVMCVSTICVVLLTYFCSVQLMKLDFYECFVNNPFVNAVSDYAWI